jgi:ankyrin repeat protein
MLLHNSRQCRWATQKYISDSMLLKELLLRGANPNVDSGNPLEITATNGFLDSMEVLLRAGAFVDVPGDRAMREAIENDQLDAVAILLSYEVDIEGGDGQPLIHASSLKKTKMVKFLLQMGANPNAQEGEALAHAASAGDVRILRMLIKYGANPRIKEDQALCEAAVSGYFAAVKFIYEAGNDAVGAARALKQISEDAGLVASDVVDYLLEKIYQYLRSRQGLANNDVRRTFNTSLKAALTCSTQTHAFCQKWAIRLLHITR